MKPEYLIHYLLKESEDIQNKFISFYESNENSEDSSVNVVGNIYRSLNAQEKSEFKNFIRSIQTDVLGSVFDLLDNQAYPTIQKQDFLLSHGSEKLNGDLTDILWAEEEEFYNKK